MRVLLGVGLLLTACGGVIQMPAKDGGTNDLAQSAATNDASVIGATDGATSTIPPAIDAAMGPIIPAGQTPPASWRHVTANLAGMTSECGNVNGIYPNPRRDQLIAGIARQGLWESTDGAASWHKIGTTGDMILNRTSDIVWDPVNADTFYQSGIYGFESPFTDGAFITTNGGTSFTGYATLASIQSHNDSIAVDFSDPARKTLISGGHEQKQTLFLSTDAGATWSNVGAALPPGLGFCTSTAVVDDKTLLVGCAVSWSGALGAIVRSTDGGKSFAQVYKSGVSGQPLAASDGSLYWSVEGGGMVRSTDKGASWTSVADNNTAGNLPPLELPDGRIVSTHGSSIVLSADKGASWKTIVSNIPFNANGFSYSAQRSEFFTWYFTCTDPNDVPADSMQGYGWDYRVN